MTPNQLQIYEFLKATGPTTDVDITVSLQEQGVITTRKKIRDTRNRMRKQGYVIKSGKYVTTPTGQKLTLWKTGKRPVQTLSSEGRPRAGTGKSSV